MGEGDGRGDAETALSPEQTVAAYFEALDGGDCATVIDLLSEGSWQAGGQYATADEAAQACSSGEAFGPAPITIQNIELVSQADGTVTLSVTGLVDGQPQTIQLTLVQDDGKWKVDLTGGPSPEDGGQVAAPPGAPATTATDPAAPATTTPTTAADPAPSPSNPLDAAAAVRAFYDATVVQDCPALVGMTTPDFWTSLLTDANQADLEGTCAAAFANGFLTSDITVQDITVDRYDDLTATLSVPLVLGDGTAYTEFVDVVFESGLWKISLLY